MLLVLINVLIIVVVGALLFWVIDRFVRDGRLANLLKILVVLICLAAILQRVLPLFGVERTAADGTQQKRDAMAWNSVAPRKPRKRQPPSSKAELREMADKAVAGWTKPITRTPAQKTACPSCGHTESITVHWAKCPRCGARM